MDVRGLVSSCLLACGCAPEVVSGVGDTGSDTTQGPSTTAMLEGHAPPDLGGAEDESSTGTTAADETHGDAPKLDVASSDIGPTVRECTGVREVDVAVTTPSVEFTATYAWWAWNYCCITTPWLVLSQEPALQEVDGVVVTPHVVVFVPSDWERTGPFMGARDVALRDVGTSGFLGPLAGLELTMPLDPAAPLERAPPSFVGTLAIEAEGWSIAGTIDAPYCDVVEQPQCPCE